MILKMGPYVINTDAVAYAFEKDDITVVSFIGGKELEISTKDTEGYFEMTPTFSQIVEFQNKQAKGSPIVQAPGNVVIR